MPATAKLAELARSEFLTRNGLARLNPFDMEHPGNALREISRQIEWDLFRSLQRREKAAELVWIILGDEPRDLDFADVIRRLVNSIAEIDGLMLSASQQRKSRAGYSYEHHIEAMLEGGMIPFQKQVVIQSKKRPDFVLPNLSRLNQVNSDALILSAKTTLRERWKQVEREKGDSDLYLSTVDETVAGSAIEDMGSIGVVLVVPESLVKSDETEYAKYENVITFKHFVEEVLARKIPQWTQ